MKKSILLLVVGIFIMSVTLSSAMAAEQISPLTATASSSWSSKPSKAVDGNYITCWFGGMGKSPWLIKFDTKGINSIGDIRIMWKENSYHASNYDIHISSDGSSWTDVYTGIGATYGETWDIREINQSARYIRLKIYSTGGPPMPAIYEFEAYKPDGPANQPPIAQASANPTSGFAPLTVYFTGSGSDSDGTIVSYSWTFGDGQTSSEQSPTYEYQNSGTYIATLTVTDDDGATGTDSVTITVNNPANQPPTASAGADPTSGDVPLTVYFTGSGSDSDGTIVSYSWTFGDAQTSSEQSPSHEYQNPGTYVATLTVTDDDGATDSASVAITATDPSGVEIPHLIRFQGNLRDSDGLPLNGTYTLTFAIYDVETTGISLWNEMQTNVTVENGFLDIELGSVTPLDLPFDKQYWLGVEVESDGEMTPRFKLTTVPYSYRSEY